MRTRIVGLIITAVALLALNVARANTLAADTLYANKLKPYGRFIINERKQLELISSAVHFGFSFTGTRCEVYTSLPDPEAHAYLQYEVDGVYQKRVRIEGAEKPLVITTPAGNHEVWIYKTTEAATGALIVSKIAGSNLTPLKVAKAPEIEFIGNSITCGAAADGSEVACGTGVYHDQHNAYMAYGPRVARALKANFVLSSVSGIGMYRNWNSITPTMPQVYDHMDLQPNSIIKWNYRDYSPKVVSIALGTNDFSKGDGVTPRKPFDRDEFVRAYIKFVRNIKSKYPSARIALLSSPMLKGKDAKLFEDCLTSVKKTVDAAYPNDKQVATYFFQPIEIHGCSYHPSVEDHGVIADQLLPFFKGLLAN